MKKITLTLMALVCALCCVFGLVACGDTVAVTDVTLNKTELTLEVGGEETLTATVAPENATDKTVTWSSSAPAIATVANGKVTAVAEGTATITATAGEKTATCAVTVNAAAVVSVTYYTYWLENDVWTYGDDEGNDYIIVLNNDNTWSLDGEDQTYEVDNGVYDLVYSNYVTVHTYATIDGKIMWLYDHKEDVGDFTKATGFAYKGTEISDEDKIKIETLSGIEIENVAPNTEVTANEWATALSYAAFTNVTVNSSYLDEGTWLAKTDLAHGAVYSFEDDGDGYTDECFYSKEENKYYRYENESGQYIKTENENIESDEELLQKAFPEYFRWYIEAFAESYSQFTFNGTDTYIATDYVGDNGDLELHSVKLKFENGKLVSFEVQVESDDPNSIVTATASRYGSTTVSLPTNFVEGSNVSSN